MKNSLLELANLSNKIKNKPLFKPLYKLARSAGLVSFLNRYRSGLKEIKFKMRIHGATIIFTDRSPKFYYYSIYKKDKAYEPALTQKLHLLSTQIKDPVFVDIGAHYGYYTLLFAKWCTGNNLVYAFEPNPNHFSTLTENVAENRLSSKAKIFQLALSNKKGRANMTGWDARVMKEDDAGNIDTLTFDEFCEQENIVPDILKIDVHGAEGKILDGMPEVLKQVKHVFCETHQNIPGYTVHDIVKMMTDAGLNVYEFTDHRNRQGGEIIPLEEIIFSNHDDRIIYGLRR